MNQFSLFDRHPLLGTRLPRLLLGDFPTPVQPLSQLCRRLETDNLFVKRDDLSARLYGGNKVRKLELLLADARRSNATTLLTCGGAGSNHALATALYGKRAGFRVVLVLASQPASPTVRKNLLADLGAGAELYHFDSYPEYAEAQKKIARQLESEEGFAPYVIPVGGTTPLGTVGFVNAGFELAAQIRQGRLPQPLAVVVPFGSMGTAVGMAIGLQAAGIGATRVTGVQVVPEVVGSEKAAVELGAKTVALLRRLDPSFPDVKVLENLIIERGHFGGGYGIPTTAASEAMQLAEEAEGLSLEGTYSGKAFAAFLDSAKRKSAGDTLLFWNTFSSRELPASTLAEDFHRLPKEFHRYFAD